MDNRAALGMYFHRGVGSIPARLSISPMGSDRTPADCVVGYAPDVVDVEQWCAWVVGKLPEHF
ncbi:hypothetical protein GCM10027580_25230 [Corynebacterium faecale]